MSKHSAPDDEPPELSEFEAVLAFILISFFALLGIWRIVLEFIV